MIKLVVFDMAGTTIDEQNIVYKTVHQALVQAGYDLSLHTVLLHAAGKEKYQAICDVVAEVSTTSVDEGSLRAIHQRFEHQLTAAYDALVPTPMPGAEHVFKILREQQVKIALNTGYKRSVALSLLEKTGWIEGQHYDLLLTADEVVRGRPYPDMILKAMAHFSCKNPLEVAKIGDSIVDIEEGLNAGCGISAGITTGAQTRTQLATARPTHIFDGLTEILPLL
jgi:phosphonatase-like hydrolase